MGVHKERTTCQLIGDIRVHKSVVSGCIVIADSLPANSGNGSGDAQDGCVNSRHAEFQSGVVGIYFQQFLTVDCRDIGKPHPP